MTDPEIVWRRIESLVLSWASLCGGRSGGDLRPQILSADSLCVCARLATHRLADIDTARDAACLSLDLCLVIANSRLDGVFCEHAAVQLDGREAELLCDLCIADLACLCERETLDPLSHVRGRGDGAAAAKSLEADVRDDAFVVYLNLQLDSADQRVLAPCSCMKASLPS